MEDEKIRVSENDIVKGLFDLGLEGKAVEVHSSLSSFGYVIGGAQTVVRALLTVCETVLVPTYSRVGRTSAPPNDRPLRNGSNYELPLRLFKLSWPFTLFREEYEKAMRTRNIIPFDPDTFGNGIRLIAT